MSAKYNNGLPQDHATRNIGSTIRICQLNIESISRSKCQYLSRILNEHNVHLVLIQETHLENEDQAHVRAKIPGYDIVGITFHHIYGTVTYARSDIKNVGLVSTSIDDDIHTIVIKIGETTVVNVYKPPAVFWRDCVLKTYAHPAIYTGDFNSHHVSWKYNQNDKNGDLLVDWAEEHDLHLVFDAKDKGSFRSGAWNREYNPDLTFVSSNHLNQPLPISRRILEDFPRSQHRPILLELGLRIPIIHSYPRPRWNFKKANWANFAADLDKCLGWIPPTHDNYSRFTGAVISIAKKHIPRGYRKEYIPGWNNDSETLYQKFLESQDSEVADELLHTLDVERKNKWIETTENIDFKYSSRKAWSLLRKLGTSQPVLREKPSVSPDQVAAHIVNLSRAPRDQDHTIGVKHELRNLKANSLEDSEHSRPFTIEEVILAFKNMKAGKAPGFDGIHTEFLINCGKYAKKWLAGFFTNVLQTGNLPREFKEAKIIAILKPGKPKDRVESYRPISLLSSCYKLLERLILNRISGKIMECIPVEQAGFRPGRSCTDQVLSLVTYIEAGFQKCLKTAAVFIDLTAAYDTVWREGLLYKFLKVFPSKTLARLLNNMLCDRTFSVVMDDAMSKKRILKNGLPQGSVLAPILFNLYIADIPETTSRKFAYADDLAIAVRDGFLGNMEQTLTNDLQILGEYYRKWRLTPSVSKTECSCFHLNNKSATQELNIYFNGSRLKHNFTPKYLGITLDRTLTYKQHLINTAAKVRTRNNILQKLCGTTWGATAETLRLSALSLVYSSAEFNAPVWLNSHHVTKLDTQLNTTMRIITGCVKSTPIYWLPILSYIPPPHLRRQEALLREYKKIYSNIRLPIHEDIPGAYLNRLRSRQPAIKAAESLHSANFNMYESWENLWTQSTPPEIHNHINSSHKPIGFDLPRKTWKTANRIRTRHGRCADLLHKWGKLPTPQCDCGAANQTILHIVQDCESRAYPGDMADLFGLSPTSIEWIENLDVEL